MPIYEYRCRQCGERSEELQRMADPPLSECKQCGGELKKLISAPAFQFKGTGWYVTDYAKKDKEKAASSSDGDAKSVGGDDSISEVKKAESTSEGTTKKESTSSASERKAKESSPS